MTKVYLLLYWNEPVELFSTRRRAKAYLRKLIKKRPPMFEDSYGIHEYIIDPEFK